MVRFFTWDEGVEWFSHDCFALWFQLATSMEGLCKSKDENNALLYTAETLFDLGRCLYDHIFFHGYETDNYLEIEDKIITGIKEIIPTILSRLDAVEDPSEDYEEVVSILKREWLSIVQACRAFPMDKKTPQNEGSTLFIVI